MSKKEGLVHNLVPEHIKLGEKEKEAILQKYQVTLRELPKISSKDPAISHLDVKEGDLIKITRKSPTAGESLFYRGVIDE